MKTNYKLVFFLLFIVLFTGGATVYFKPPSTPLIGVAELWNDEQAKKIAQEAFDFDHAFIINENKFRELLNQASKGDKNAMLYAYQAQFAIDRIFKIEMAEHDEKVLKYYKPNSPSLFNNYDAMKENAQSIIYLADKGHPAASYFIINNLSDYWLNKLGNNEAEQKRKAVSLLQNSIKGGYNMQQNWAEFSLFSFDEAWFSSLKDANKALSEQQLNEVMEKGYKEAAMNGSLFSALRIAEGYLYGIGYKQDNENAYIWSKLIDTSFPFLYEKVKESNNKDDENALMELHKKAMEIIKEAQKPLSVNQRIGAQKSVEELMKNVNFHYEQWMSERRPVPPMQ